MGDRKKDGITFSSKIIRCLAVLDNLKKKKNVNCKNKDYDANGTKNI